MTSPSSTTWTELAVTSAFTFLTGASHPEAYVRRAARHGCSHATLADTNTVAGVVRGHVEAARHGIRFLPGCRLQLDGPTRPVDVIVYPTSREDWGLLCRLLTLGRRRAGKGTCTLSLHDLLDHRGDLLAIAPVPDIVDAEILTVLESLRRLFDGDRLSLGITRHLDGLGNRMPMWLDLSRRIRAPLVAINDARHHDPGRQRLLDVVTCIRHGCTLETAGRRLARNAERHLKSPEEMAELFADCPAAMVRAAEIANAAGQFSLDQLRYDAPRDACPDHRNEDDHLAALVESHLPEHYPDGVPASVRHQLKHEFDLIRELGYASYFLTVHDLVAFARRRGILCQGRGAAANSAVCYVLGLTAVDPGRSNLLFERFVSRERNEPPDIDIDFEHERREEVMQYIYQRYGRDRAALTATVITYRWKSAIRETGKVLGLSLDVTERLAREGHDLASEARDTSGPLVRRAIDLARDLRGLPRHLSQHVGGFVMTRGPLCELVPIENAAMENRTVIQWDKDDLDAMGILKVDVLALGMLSCIRRCLDEINAWNRDTNPPLTLATIPAEDPEVYDMVCRADTVGVFQIESRAQMAMLPRMRPRCFYDLVIEIALVRPGPIHGGMVHPYLRRREGREPVTYPDPAVRKVLQRTLGVPLFQEQAMALAMVAGGFSGDEADELRRAMAAWKRRGDDMERLGGKLVQNMRDRGYPEDFIQRCWKQIHGFSEYGFPESHAASFALLVYASAWLRCHYPAAFACAILNSQPMGFYGPAQLIRDAREHGVAVRPVDVNHSLMGCTLEPGGSDEAVLRLGFRMIRGLGRDDALALAHEREHGGPFHDLADLRHRTGLSPGVLRRLARADAFGSLGLDRQEALWELQRLDRGHLPLFDDLEDDPDATGRTPHGLPPISLPRKVLQDYQATGLSLKAHPMSFLRTALEARGATTARALADAEKYPDRSRATVAGLVLVRQRPGTARGMTFMTLEDETGVANLVITPPVYERNRSVIRTAGSLVAHGQVQRTGEILHLNARTVTPLDDHVQVDHTVYQWT
ncbi:MAG: error-prone DNA polymerase [Phycisphaerales bacterium]|nr:error-prone DNA polymerase [Phycisphaerales bacterium]